VENSQSIAAPQAHTGSQHADSEHCALTQPMGGTLPAASAVAAVLPHAPVFTRGTPLVDVPRRDASRAWLAAHTRAPLARVDRHFRRLPPTV